MGFLSFLTGSSKAMDTAGNVVDGAIAGIDKLWFTDEEKSEASISTLKLVLERAKQAISESSVRSMTRRIIAIMFCGTFLLLLIMAAFVYPLFNEWAEHLFKCAIVLKNPIIAVIIFYFGSYGISYLIKTKKDK